MARSPRCPDCSKPIRLDGTPQVGRRVTCPSCMAFLEVINLNPIELDWAADIAWPRPSDEMPDGASGDIEASSSTP